MTSKRDDIRTAVFSKEHLEIAIVEVFGIEIELHQPPLREILKLQDFKDKAQAIAIMLTKYCFVPGTAEAIFEDTDADSLLSIPFGKDFSKLQDAINKLIGVDVNKEVEELKADPTKET